ncbi:unnamed protein product [Pieris brassicae]|uniref:Dynein intermediate chain 3, ciliary n=1 Tax=Pieris brassicae TaxID=7116 RepID=A0A9P0SJU1_PIEBR|nr:unnamed protein product [Pieris brassicae]
MDPNITYTYFKQRKDFGRQVMFCEVAPQMLDSINPDKSEQNKYCLRNPVHREVQTCVRTSENNINTKVTKIKTTGINHSEGGWPKDIFCTDEEATARYRRRFERDDGYVDAVKTLNPEFEHYIQQNNAIEMYNIYFKEIASEKPVEKFLIKVNTSYKDVGTRPVSDICWTHEDQSKLAVSYCNKSFPEGVSLNNDFVCHLWDIENLGEPCSIFCPPSACWQLVTSPASSSMFFAGLENGKVCIFDIRSQIEPIAMSPDHLAHRDPVSALLFIPSRLNTDFFSGSTDGLCMWWDVRNISKPIDSLLMAIRIPQGEVSTYTNTEPVSALQYDRAFSTKFLCGTDTGFVISVNRKGKSHQEVMSAVFNAHDGPVKSVHRSPCTSKVFITCGGWKVNIWSEDIHSSPIISGSAHDHYINDVIWAPKRYSAYMTVSADGKFRYWDLLRKYREPMASVPVSQDRLLKLTSNEDGQYIATGDSKGTLYLLSLSDVLVNSDDNDKQLMIQTLDRETHREHILETRVKEIKLKLKAGEDKKECLEMEVENEEDKEDTEFMTLEDEYRAIVSAELRNMEGRPTYIGGDPMRRR